MREIKFRAWDGDKKEMSSEIRLDFAHGLRLISTTDLGFDMSSDDKCVLMQFTGLLDKNGKEIYEGDIVKYTRINGKEIIAEIEWRSEDGCYYYFNHKEPVDSDVSNKESTFFIATTITEIIGNIYENPELLTL